MDEEIEEDEEPKRKKKQFFLKNCVTIKNFRELELEELENLIRHSFPTPLEKYSWFSADVISLCKLGFSHVGAHARCEIVSNCKQICALTIKVFK